MKKQIGNFIAVTWAGVENRLRSLCSRPSPAKRFVAVLAAGSVLAAVNIYLVVSPVFSVGERDAEAAFMKIRHIESLPVQQQYDSVLSVTKLPEGR